MSQHSGQQEYSHESEENIGLEDSFDMNEEEKALFLDIKKSKSNDSFLGRLIGTTAEMENRPLVINMNEFCQPKPINNSNENPLIPKGGYRIFKRVKKQKKHNKCDYQKNICGYITKKIIRQFIGPTFQDYIQSLCTKYSCSSDQARKFYLSKIEYITGPSHIPALLTPQKKDSQDIIGSKLAFREFFCWFLKERYLRYLLLEGKMTNKKAYIEYKNNVLFNFIEQNQQEIDNLVKKILKQKNEEKRQLQDQMTKLRQSMTTNARKSKLSRDKTIIITKSF